MKSPAVLAQKFILPSSPWIYLIKIEELGTNPCFQEALLLLFSCVRLFATPRTAACQVSLFFTISRSLTRLMSIELVMPSKYLVFRQPLLLLPSNPLSIRVFSNESALHIRWPKTGASASASVLPMNEYSELISFRIDWLDLLAVQGILKSLLQHLSSKASIFGAQPSLWPILTSIHDYWKNYSFDGPLLAK